MSFEPRLALRALDEHGVSFVLIGGLAAQLLGAPLTTVDVDVCCQRSEENHRRLAEALKELQAKLRMPGVGKDLPCQLEAATITAGGNFTFDTTAGWFDVLAVPSGTDGYDDLVKGATQLDLGDGLLVSVAALDDLIRMKQASRRPKDQAHLYILEALREEISRAKG
ncbi:hypothetical protein BH20ACT2_BH20ACT2_22250 [soil metagenome]